MSSNDQISVHKMTTRIAIVFGATGQQGSSVVRALLEDGTFRPRAVTRDVNSSSARALAQLGAEIVSADFSDKDAIKNVVTGAEVVFLVTVPFSPVSPEDVQGKNVVDASKEAGVRFMVFSTLPGVSELSNGKYTNATHCDDKEKIRKYIQASGVPHASIGTGFFFENTLKPFAGLPLEKTDNGYVWNAYARPGSVTVHTWVTRDMGPSVVALFTKYTTRASEIVGQYFVLGSARTSFEDFAAELSKALGAPVHFKSAGKAGFLPLSDMFDSVAEYPWYGEVDIPDPRLEKLGVKTGTIEEFGRTVFKSHLAE